MVERTDQPNGLVWGYHGTSDRFAEAHIRRGMPHTTFPGDWLGHGAYFWEGDFTRAAMWAEDRVVPRFGGQPVVLAAVIDLSDCLDLTRVDDRQFIQTLAARAYDEITAEGMAGLRQDEMWRELDCRVIEYTLRNTLRKDGTPRFTTIRGAFQEGRPLHSSPEGAQSFIRELDHIQINVVDRGALQSLSVVNL